MDPKPSTSLPPPPAKQRRRGASTTVDALGNDILCIIFAFLDVVQLIRCATVCKSWNNVINKLKLLQIQYHKQTDSVSLSDVSSCSEKSINIEMERLAMEQQRLSLEEGPVDIFQWKGHSVGDYDGNPFYRLYINYNGINKCRMKMGLILTGVGDKVMRLWSAERCKRLDEYFLPDKAPLIDFDFDEGKVVGLVGTRICIWRRIGTRDLFSSREGLFTRGLCMRYVDPQAVVGCEDGKVRVFDMYSRKISQIIKMHPGAVSCLSFTDEQLIVSGSSLGSISISDLSSDQQVAALDTTSSGGGIKALCLNPSSYLLYAGSSTGYASCWDLRCTTALTYDMHVHWCDNVKLSTLFMELMDYDRMHGMVSHKNTNTANTQQQGTVLLHQLSTRTLRRLWDTRVSPNVLYSMHHLRNDKSTLVVGGIDGVLRIVDQNSGEVLSRCIMDDNRNVSNRSTDKNGVVEKKKAIKLSEDDRIDLMPNRPPITCLAVGMQKVVTTHSDKYIRVWKFSCK